MKKKNKIKIIKNIFKIKFICFKYITIKEKSKILFKLNIYEKFINIKNLCLIILIEFIMTFYTFIKNC